jgi:hypothetical protein
MVIKYSKLTKNIPTFTYHSKTLQHLPKFGIFGLKTNHLATLVSGANPMTSEFITMYNGSVEHG